MLLEVSGIEYPIGRGKEKGKWVYIEKGGISHNNEPFPHQTNL